MSVISSGTTATTTLKVTGDTNGVLDFQVGDSGSGGTTAIYINANGQVDLGYIDGQRILGQFSGSTTPNNNTVFQTRNALSRTEIYAAPASSSTNSSWIAANANDITNCSKIAINAQSADCRLVSGINGTGTYLPLTFYTNNAEQMRITTAGGVSFGATGTAYGTSGQVLTSAGNASPTWTTLSSSPIASMDVFTTGTSATWTIPTGVTKVRVTVQAGGGAGAGGTGAGGGGAGGTAIKVLSNLVAGSLTYTVGGAGASSQVASGTNNTITTVSATAGAAGTTNGETTGGAGGVGSNGDLNIQGGGGGCGVDTGGFGVIAGAGGNSYLAGGGKVGVAGKYGGGGGGNSGAGGSGVIIFEY